MPLENKTVLVCIAHPDDETLCSGTIAKLAAAGNRVHILVATSGNRGTHTMKSRPDEVAALREEEMKTAASVLGVTGVEWLGIEDGALHATADLKQRVFAVERRIDPDIVFTFDPWARYEFHSDHRTIGFACLEAAYLARCVWYFPEDAQRGTVATRSPEVYLFAPSEPNYTVDVTEFVVKKVEAGYAHRSQFASSGMGFMERMKAALDALSDGTFDLKRQLHDLTLVAQLCTESFHKVYDTDLRV